MTITDPQAAVGPDAAEEAAAQVLRHYAGSMLTYMIDIGHRTGLLATIADGSGTSEELAARAGLTERYVREWLAAMATGGLVDYDPAGERFSLPPALAAVLTSGPVPLASCAGLQTHLGKHVHGVARAFTDGGGVPYSAYRPEFTQLMDQMSRAWFDGGLVEGLLPLVDGLEQRLDAGIAVADLGCGTGHALVVLARRFPASTFVGYDVDEGAVAAARDEATRDGLTNLRFEVHDIAEPMEGERFDAVFIFDALHDQVDPAGVLRCIHDSLGPDGVVVLKEPRGAENLADDIGNPFAPILYGTSVLHCLTISLAHGGAGIGTAMRESLARGLLGDAGFEDVVVHVAPGDPADVVYIATKDGAR